MEKLKEQVSQARYVFLAVINVLPQIFVEGYIDSF